VWPEYWPLEELEKVKASITVRNWNAQYMQDPTSRGRSYFKTRVVETMEEEPVPQIASRNSKSYDTAFSKKETADYSCNYYLGSILSR
jgi:hypothetical protein